MSAESSGPGAPGRPDDTGDALPTEAANPASAELDRLSLADAFDVFDAADEAVNAAVRAAKPAIVRAIALVVERLRGGGRLVYAGAGTSGRLGVLDASECPPTFGSEPEQVQGRIAGGPEALTRAVEGAEDSAELGRAALADVTARDVVVGIAASGRTPWVHGALAQARENGAATVFLACVPFARAPDSADVSIRVVTGPEVLAGSTRLKAGTATKLVLNRITTLAFARLGKVHGSRMIDVDTRGNAKLARRGLALLGELTGLADVAAAELLARANGRVKPAVLMQLRACTLAEAEARLGRSGGSLRRALGEPAG
jgi:N-acetylmuramic acid 6-phosphate etherase